MSGGDFEKKTAGLGAGATKIGGDKQGEQHRGSISKNAINSVWAEKTEAHGVGRGGGREN